MAACARSALGNEPRSLNQIRPGERRLPTARHCPSSIGSMKPKQCSSVKTHLNFAMGHLSSAALMAAAALPSSLENMWA
jgi:hypothetical protein